MLQISAIDAVVAGLAAAFFAGLVGANAYLLRQLLSVQQAVAEQGRRLDDLKLVEQIVGSYATGGGAAKTLKSRPSKHGGDEFAR